MLDTNRKYYKFLMGSTVHGFAVDGSDTDYVYLYVPTLMELLDKNHKLSYETEYNGNKVVVRDLRSLVNNLDKCDINDLQLLYQMGDIKELAFFYSNRKEIVNQNRNNLSKRLLGYSNQLLKRYNSLTLFEPKLKEYFRVKHMHLVALNVMHNKLDTFTFNDLGVERANMLKNRVDITVLDTMFNSIYAQLETLGRNLLEQKVEDKYKTDWAYLGNKELERLILSSLK